LNSPKRLFDKQRVELQFDLAAGRYNQFASVQRAMADDVLDHVKQAAFSADARIVDLGCGTGELLGRLVELGFSRPTGLDLSRKMLEVAAGHNPSATLLHGDMESLPLEDGSFNIVVSSAAIQWCNTAAAANEMFRVLTPGGKAIVGTFVDSTLRQWSEAFEKLGLPQRVHPFQTVGEVTRSFEDVGFTGVTASQCVRTLEFDSVKAMFRSVQRLGATNAMESRSQPIGRKDYLALVDHFEALLKRDGTLGLDYACVVLEAKRSA